jgi:hypothetical protein
VQLLGGVPENVIHCVTGRRLLHVARATSGGFWPWPLRVMAVPLLVTVRALTWVLCTVFGLCAYIPLTSLMAGLVSYALALLLWRALGWVPCWWRCHPCHEGFRGGPPLVSPSISSARGRVCPMSADSTACPPHQRKVGVIGLRARPRRPRPG